MQSDEKEKKIDVYAKYNAFRPLNNPDKKHPCPDCFNCLFCSDARCKVCLSSKNCKNSKSPCHEKTTENKPPEDKSDS